jgi:uncharacterized OB-fold protein
MSAYGKPLPVIDETNAGHWNAARCGELHVQRCLTCSTLRYPASRWCSSCLGEESDWLATSGRGQVWSWCIFHRAYFKGFEPELPYIVALVELDEGVRIYSNLIGIPRERLRVGLRLRAVFEAATDEVTLIKFEEDSGEHVLL